MALFQATPARRRQVMIVLLVLATCGAVIRHFAANPSTLRDVGTLMLVLWLPAVGNLIAYLIRQFPRDSRPVPVGFPAGGAFTPHLQVLLQPLQQQTPGAPSPECILVVGRRGFTARTRDPLVAIGLSDRVAIELLQPRLALRELKPGTEFHLLVAGAAVATGTVLATLPEP